MPAALSRHEHPWPSSPRYSLNIDSADIANLVADRLRVNKLALKVPAWVASAVARLTEVPGHLRVPPSLAACAVLRDVRRHAAFGDTLLAHLKKNKK